MEHYFQKLPDQEWGSLCTQCVAPIGWSAGKRNTKVVSTSYLNIVEEIFSLYFSSHLKEQSPQELLIIEYTII